MVVLSLLKRIIPNIHIIKSKKNLGFAGGNNLGIENSKGEVWKFQANISKAKKLLEYKPKIDMNEGLVKTIEWYKKSNRERI